MSSCTKKELHHLFCDQIPGYNLTDYDVFDKNLIMINGSFHYAKIYYQLNTYGFCLVVLVFTGHKIFSYHNQEWEYRGCLNEAEKYELENNLLEDKQ